MKYGYPKGLTIIAVQSAVGYAATDDSFKPLWCQVPDTVLDGATTTIAPNEGEATQDWINRVTAADGWSNPAPIGGGGRWVPISKFMMRLGLKLVAIQTAANGGNATAQVAIQFINVTPNVDLDDPDTGQVLDMLVADGLIDAADKAAALA